MDLQQFKVTAISSPSREARDFYYYWQSFWNSLALCQKAASLAMSPRLKMIMGYMHIRPSIVHFWYTRITMCTYYLHGCRTFSELLYTYIQLYSPLAPPIYRQSEFPRKYVFDDCRPKYMQLIRTT